MVAECQNIDPLFRAESSIFGTFSLFFYCIQLFLFFTYLGSELNYETLNYETPAISHK